LQLESLSELEPPRTDPGQRRVTRSVRPVAPGVGAADATSTNGRAPSIADTFERLLSDDLDAGFAALEGKSERTLGEYASHEADLEEVRKLFAQLAANHMRQVRDFMIDLRWGQATVDWLSVCEPSVQSLRRAADKLEFSALSSALEAFGEALGAARAAGGRTIEAEARDALLARYEELGNHMPGAFALDMDRSQREAVILQSLLMQVPDVKKVTIDKLYAAGLTTLETMYLAKPDDVAATTGLSIGLAEQIVQRFQAYRDEIKAAVPDATRSQERERIAELVTQLRTQHTEYERVAEEWSDEAGARKKELRQARAQTLLDIHVQLARLGEVERLRELERLPFERKLTHLEAFLEEAQEKYVPEP
jgi:hypothetical protein